MGVAFGRSFPAGCLNAAGEISLGYTKRYRETATTILRVSLVGGEESGPSGFFVGLQFRVLKSSLLKLCGDVESHLKPTKLCTPGAQ